MFKVVVYLFALALLAVPVKASGHEEDHEGQRLSAQMEDLAKETVKSPYDFGDLYPYVKQPFQSLMQNKSVIVKELCVKFGYCIILQQLSKPLLLEKFINRTQTLRGIGISIYGKCDTVVMHCHMISLIVKLEEEFFCRKLYSYIDRTILKQMSNGIIRLYPETKDIPVPQNLLRESATSILTISNYFSNILSDEETVTISFLKQILVF